MEALGLPEPKDEDLPETMARKVRVVELPVGATEDRVVGTLDLEHALKAGEKRVEPGLLAAAHRGILYVDEVNLLDDHVVDVLLDSAAMGVNSIEREGISFSHPARFTLVGTMNPEEGELRPQLLDRFGLCVNIEGIGDADDRVAVMERRAAFDEDPSRVFRKMGIGMRNPGRSDPESKNPVSQGDGGKKDAFTKSPSIVWTWGWTATGAISSF